MTSKRTCRRVREDLAAYREGWLPSARAAEIAEHLRSCEECSRAAERDAAIVDAARTLPREEPRPITWSEALETHRPARRAAPRPWRWSPALAATALLLLALWEFKPHTAYHAPPPPTAVAPAQSAPADSGTFVLAHASLSVGAMQGDPNRALLMSVEVGTATK